MYARPSKVNRMGFKKFLFLVFVWTQLWCICLCDGQNLTLHEYQKGERTSSCTKGLLVDYDNDTIIIRAKAICKDKNNMLYNQTIIFRYTSQNSFVSTTLCHAKFRETFKEPVVCNFTISTVDNCTYYINITVNTSEALSGAKIFGYVVAHKERFFSNEIMLPELYSIQNTTKHLIVNGREYSTDQLIDPIISDSHVNITFQCESPAGLCSTEIFTDDTVYAYSGKRSVFSRNYSMSQTVKVTIKYDACRLDREYNTIKFRLKIASQEEADTLSISKKTNIGLGVLLACSFLVNIVTLFCKLYPYCKKLTDDRTSNSKLKSKPQVAATGPYEGMCHHQLGVLSTSIIVRDINAASSANTEGDLMLHPD